MSDIIVQGIEDIKDVLTRIETDISEGHIDALEGYVYLKGFIDRVKTFDSMVKGYALDEASTQPTKTFTVSGHEVTYRVGSAIYDYDKDDEYRRIKSELDARKKLLDTVSKSGQKGIIGQDGEIVEAVPVKSYRADSITVKTRKEE